MNTFDKIKETAKELERLEALADPVDYENHHLRFYPSTFKPLEKENNDILR